MRFGNYSGLNSEVGKVQSFRMISGQLRVFRPPQARTASTFVPHGIPGTVWVPPGFLPSVFASFEVKGSSPLRERAQIVSYGACVLNRNSISFGQPHHAHATRPGALVLPNWSVWGRPALNNEHWRPCGHPRWYLPTRPLQRQNGAEMVVIAPKR